MVAMIPLGCEGCVMSDEDLEGVESIGGLNKLTGSIQTCIEHLCKATRTTEEVGINTKQYRQRHSVVCIRLG